MRMQSMEPPISFANITQFQLAVLSWHMRIHLEGGKLVPGGVMISVRRGRWSCQAQDATIEGAVFAGIHYIITHFCPHARRAVFA